MVDGLAKAANSVQALHGLKEPMKGWALHGLVDAMGDVFLVSLPFLAIALVLAIITPEQRLAGRTDRPRRPRARTWRPPRPPPCTDAVLRTDWNSRPGTFRGGCSAG